MEVCEHIISEMGADLHDDLIQRLSILRLSIDSLERSLSDRAESEALLVSIKGEFQEVILSVRKISRKLMSIPLEENSFQQGIAMLCQNLERPGLGIIHFQPTGNERKITPLARTYLYRLIQELIHNAFKHSSAWNVWVRLVWDSNRLTVEVEDDGTGFSKITEFIGLLRKKHNTLKMRCAVIQASIVYQQGENGLLARIIYPLGSQSQNGG